MWIASTSGFYSIVQHRDFPDQVLIRARVKKDLESIFDPSRIVFTPDGDYQYRVFLNKAEAGKIFLDKMMKIDYSNFKNHVAQNPEQRDKLDAYHEIWRVMWDYSTNQQKL